MTWTWMGRWGDPLAAAVTVTLPKIKMLRATLARVLVPLVIILIMTQVLGNRFGLLVPL